MFPITSILGRRTGEPCIRARSLRRSLREVGKGPLKEIGNHEHREGKKRLQEKELKFVEGPCMSQASQIELMIKNPPANAEDIRDAGSNFSILAWRISWTEEPGEIQSIGSQRFRYD